MRRSGLLVAFASLGAPLVMGYATLPGRTSSAVAGVPEEPDDMVRIAGGNYAMGTDDARSDANEWLSRSVPVEAFWIDRAPVTNAQIKDFFKDFEQYPFRMGSSLNASGIDYGMLRQQEALKRLNDVERMNPTQ